MVPAEPTESMGAASAEAGPLYEYVISSRLRRNRPLHRALLLLRAALLLLLVAYRVRTFNGELGVVALICEAWFCVSAILLVSSRWWLVEKETHPDRLLQRVDELPAVDVFVTTADPTKEPPLITMNTILSVLAIDYPTEKLACYLSDDGGSLLTLWSLKQTVAFAKQSWLPFCTKFSPHVRPLAPGPYFARKGSLDVALKYGFANEWHDIKEKYDTFATKISSMSTAYSKSHHDTMENLLKDLMASSPYEQDLSTYASWASNYNIRKHGSHCEILVDRPSKLSNPEFPYLVYLSREKHPNRKHHFKAGAMNALLRVSGIMTNAPFVLNLDCDMYVNAPNPLLQAMCIFIENTRKEVADITGFVQFPQCFEGVDDDIYGSSMAAAMEIFLKGMDGVQGPPYCGTGCIHKRVSLYGSSPRMDARHLSTNGQKIGEMFGHSHNLIISVEELLSSKHCISLFSTKDALLMEANILMDCAFEEKTSWGKEVGLIYGSLTEDILTGLKIHGRGWKSSACIPQPPAFIGCIPSTSEDALTTWKRWSIGQLEILFSSNSPLSTKNSQAMSLTQRSIYLYIFNRVLLCFPLFAYSLLPTMSVLKEHPMFPQVHKVGVLIPLNAAAITYIIGIYESKVVGVGLQMWLNTERMDYLVAISSNILAAWELVLVKVLGIAEITFTITPKDKQGHNQHKGNDKGDEKSNQGFEVNSTQPIFILPTIVVLFNIVALLVAGYRLVSGSFYLSLRFLGEAACSTWILFLLYPFTKGILLWLGRQSGPLVLSSSTILYAMLIVVPSILLTTFI